MAESISDTSNSTNLSSLFKSSCLEISSIRTPLSMNPMTSAMFSISLRICDEIRIVIPNSWDNRLSSSRISLIPKGSSPFIGSSRISSSGLCMMAAAIPRRCFMPNENSLNLFDLASLRLTTSRAKLILWGLKSPLIFAMIFKFSYAVRFS